MVITPDDQLSKVPSEQKVQQEEPHDEPPPSYSSHTDLESGSTSSPTPPTFKTKPTNYLALSTGDSSIRGEFVIDPSIRIPSNMLPPLGPDETEDDRKNLSLKSKNSSVEGEIWLLGPSPSRPTDTENATGVEKPQARRTIIALNSDHGSVRAQLHTLDGAAPFALTAHAAHGSIRLALPRHFHGLLALSTRHGSTSLSDTLAQNATQLSQLGDTRRYFVGDFVALGEDAWEGDQVELDAPHGSVRVKYVDEVAESQGKKGLFSRLFGK